MTSPFRNSQKENTALITISSGPPGNEKETEKTSSSAIIKVIVHENQPTLNSKTTPGTTRMFLRRRIVLLTLALILAIVLITMTIVGLLISSYNDRQQAEAEAREGQNTHMEIEKNEDTEKKISSMSTGFESDGSETEERLDDTFLPAPPATANTDSSGSGSEPSGIEKTGDLIDEYESFKQVGSGDSSKIEHQSGSGDSTEAEDHNVGSGDFSTDRRDFGSGTLSRPN